MVRDSKQQQMFFPLALKKQTVRCREGLRAESMGGIQEPRVALSREKVGAQSCSHNSPLSSEQESVLQEGA